MPPEIGLEGVFDGVPKSIPLYVPGESIEAYQLADGWKEFMIITGINSHISDKVRIYPNPSSGKLNIATNNTGIAGSGLSYPGKRRQQHRGGNLCDTAYGGITPF